MQETRIYSSPKIPFFYKKSSEMISDDFLRFIFFYKLGKIHAGLFLAHNAPTPRLIAL